MVDNCEHLVLACAELIAALLRDCPHLQVLATSREPLGIAGEAICRVQPLDVAEASASRERIEAVPAARLFVDRARAVQHTFVVTDDNAAAIARDLHLPRWNSAGAGAGGCAIVGHERPRARRTPRGRSPPACEPSHASNFPTIGRYRRPSSGVSICSTSVSARCFGTWRCLPGGWSLELAETVCADALIGESDVVEVTRSACREIDGGDGDP